MKNLNQTPTQFLNIQNISLKIEKNCDIGTKEK